MLIQFRFRNFKSFKDDTILDLSATNIVDRSERVIQVGRKKILSTAAIYGANASGKSNVIEAFRYMTNYVLNSFAYGGTGNDSKEGMRKPKLTPFLFDEDSKEAETSFEVYFINSTDDGCKLYNYGFTLNKKGVVEEWLNVKAKTARKSKAVFHRSNKELNLAGLDKTVRRFIKASLYEEALVVSLGAKQRIAELKIVQDWFDTINFADFGNPYENAWLSLLVPRGFDSDKAVQEEVLDYFAAFDSSIIDFKVELIKNGEEGREGVKIDAIHHVLGSNDTASIPLQEESAGTLKMFALYPVLQDTLAKGSVLFVDELNARLHPDLVQDFLNKFFDPKINPRHAQLVFTIHDAYLLSDNLLRRDEIWFTKKSQTGVTTLYSLAEFIDEEQAKYE